MAARQTNVVRSAADVVAGFNYFVIRFANIIVVNVTNHIVCVCEQLQLYAKFLLFLL